jgi:hypothetical protein
MHFHTERPIQFHIRLRNLIICQSRGFSHHCGLVPHHREKAVGRQRRARARGLKSFIGECSGVCDLAMRVAESKCGVRFSDNRERALTHSWEKRETVMKKDWTGAGHCVRETNIIKASPASI